MNILKNIIINLTQAKFNVEMVSTYKIKKIKSAGNMFFEINIEEIKQMLTKKYKYNFDEEEEPEPSPLDNGLEPEPDYKALYFELLAKQNQIPEKKEIEQHQKPKQEKRIVKNQDEEPEEDEECEILFVPYEYKNDAKKDGLRFEPSGKFWYVRKSNPKYLWCCRMWDRSNFRDDYYGTHLIHSKYDELKIMFNDERTSLKENVGELTDEELENDLQKLL